MSLSPYRNRIRLGVPPQAPSHSPPNAAEGVCVRGAGVGGPVAARRRRAGGFGGYPQAWPVGGAVEPGAALGKAIARRNHGVEHRASLRARRCPVVSRTERKPVESEGLPRRARSPRAKGGAERSGARSGRRSLACRPLAPVGPAPGEDFEAGRAKPARDRFGTRKRSAAAKPTRTEAGGAGPRRASRIRRRRARDEPAAEYLERAGPAPPDVRACAWPRAGRESGQGSDAALGRAPRTRRPGPRPIQT